MENEIKIKVPEGKKAVQNVDTNGDIVIKFEDAEPIRSKSWEEFCKKHSVVENEWYISSNACISGPTSGPNNRDVVNDANFLETKEDAEGILALIQLTRLHDEWINGWEPKWGEGNSEMKYFITISRYKTITIESCWDYPHFLIFPTEEMAKEFLNCFEPLLEKAKKFI